jgi:hypothetical protein
VKRLLLGGMIALSALAGCATNAPKYNSDFDNVGKLRSADLAPARIGAITKDEKAKEDVDHVTLRGGALQSPYGSYTAYLREALQEEFEDARLLDANSQIEVAGVLLKNTVDTGVSTGSAEVSARLNVKRAGTVVYEDTKSAHIEWDSNFVGAIAIPRANENYPKALQKLLGEFYADPKFLAALKKSGAP